MRKEIEKMRLRTRISEAFAGTKLPYPTQREYAILQVKALQEEYKMLTGEYLEEYTITESKGPDNTKEMEIDALIAVLQKLKAKQCVNVQLVGTLLCKEAGNYVILSTDKQM